MGGMWVLGFTIAAFIQALTAFAGKTDNDQVNQAVKTRISECQNFYKHVCHDWNKESQRTSPAFLKTLLYQKLRGILEDEYENEDEKQRMESGAGDEHVNIGKMARKLYSVCVQDGHKNSKEKVRESLKEMLRSVGIDEWPLTDESHQQYGMVLKKTGLRPVATIAPVPDLNSPRYMLAVNAPLPRFAPYPDTMVKIRSRRRMYKAYKDLIRTVLILFCETQDDKVQPKTGSHDDVNDYSSSYEEDSSVVEESQSAAEEEIAIEQVISDIIEVEVSLAKLWWKVLGNRHPKTEAESQVLRRSRHLPGLAPNPPELKMSYDPDEQRPIPIAASTSSVQQLRDARPFAGRPDEDVEEWHIHYYRMILIGRINDYYQTDTVENWQRRFGRFPFFAGLSMDIKRANRTLENNYEVGIHLLGYFKKLAEYLETLEVRKLVNYVGWYFVREVADVMTLEVRNYLNSFLRTVPKPGIQVVLNEHHCIDKLIGNHGVMEAGIAHLYLLRYFGERAIKNASEVARHLNSSFYSFVRMNSWMDDEAHEKSLQWMRELQYQMGAPHKLYDQSSIQQQYDLVKLRTQDTLLRYIYAYRENNFLQMLRKNGQAYDRKHIWPVSALATDGRYSEFYTSLGMPAGALQEPVFRYNASGANIFGSMGTLTAEKLADAFLIEGRMWLQRKGKYQWTKNTTKSFRARLACLKKKNSQQKNNGKKLKGNSQENFERKGDQDTLRLKVLDHIGLRISYNAFIEMVSERGRSYSKLQRESIPELLRDFFTAFARRQCGPDGADYAEYRVNFALRTYREFALAFDCRDGQMMKSEDDCQIVVRSELQDSFVKHKN